MRSREKQLALKTSEKRRGSSMSAP
jgi:hypothetical protein